MRHFMALFFLVLSSPALAASAATCFSACKVLNESKSFRCMTTYADGLGAVMVVDKIEEKSSEREKLGLLALRDCFFDVGGEIFEIHRKDKPKHFVSCSANSPRASTPFLCEKASASETLRNVKVKR